MVSRQLPFVALETTFEYLKHAYASVRDGSYPVYGTPEYSKLAFNVIIADAAGQQLREAGFDRLVACRRRVPEHPLNAYTFWQYIGLVSAFRNQIMNPDDYEQLQRCNDPEPLRIAARVVTDFLCMFEKQPVITDLGFRPYRS